MKTHTPIKAKIAIALLMAMSLNACINLTDEEKQQIKEYINSKTGVITTKGDTITVNDTNYDTNGAVVVADGVQTDASALKEGMVVTVSGTEYSDGRGVATQISFDDEVEGIVSTNAVTPGSASGTLTVMGQTVHVDASTIFASYDVSDLSVADIDPGNIVEVSGYSSGKGEIWATRIEVKNMQYNPGEEIELKGYVSNATSNSFQIGNLTVDMSNAALDSDFMGTVSNGQYIKVSSTQGFDNNGNLIATELDLKSTDSKEIKHRENDENVEVKGAITGSLSGNQIEINGSLVLLDNNLSISDAVRNSLTKGNIVEAEGYVDANGQFVVTKLELENENEFDDDAKSSLDNDSENDSDSDNSSQKADDDDD
ncbi:MAG TPA: hypothetical protein ENJ28_11735 [Gammaproteobacteria bacterium]|nr:hypothetical protein [Gammaproteobacteria bacterium]